jgi:hypothetical protein
MNSERALAVHRSQAVGAGIATTDDHHALPFGADEGVVRQRAECKRLAPRLGAERPAYQPAVLDRRQVGRTPGECGRGRQQRR